MTGMYVNQSDYEKQQQIKATLEACLMASDYVDSRERIHALCRKIGLTIDYKADMVVWDEVTP
jgi:hypothetical protein